ncbi:MAG: hypothetical protein HYS26_03130 [Candidatus Kaiserbacteria bacterium]|nr:MAG: hypothetical protein HYS26_03130 [Candidatus Kaiserbacteria bacterium]
MRQFESHARTIVLLLFLGVEIALLLAKAPPRAFDFYRLADQIVALPRDGGTVSERDIPKALRQWVAELGKGRESPDENVRILRERYGLLFYAVRVVPENERD